MTRTTPLCCTLILGFLALGFLTMVNAQELGRSVIVSEAQTQDLYAAGSEVDVRAAVAGDVVAAGNNVVIAGSVSEDVIAAGRKVTISGDVVDDVRLAGRDVTLAGEVAGHAVMAGQTVRLDAGSSVGDWTWVAGQSIYLAGTVGGDLRAFGERLELNGQVGGNAELAGQRLRVGDNAVINGNLTWRGERAPKISDEAVITGEIAEGEALPEFDRPRPGFGSRLYMALTLAITAGLLYTLWRANYQAYGSLAEARPGASLAMGLALFAATPVVIVLLFVSGIGALFGVLLVLVYLLMLLLGGLSGVILMGRLGVLRLRDERSPGLGTMWAAIGIVALVLAILYIWSPLGGIVSFILMLLGLGAISLDTWRRVRA